MVHEVELAGYDVKYAGDGTLTLGTWDSYGIERLHITADSDWDGLTVLATFRIGSTSVRALMDGEGMVDVPPEATSEAGSGVIVFSGTDGEMLRVSRNLRYKVLDHDPIDGEDSQPTPSEWEQLVGRVDEATEEANRSAKRAEQSADSAAGSATAADASARQAAASGAAVEADKSAAQTAAQEAKKSETAAAGSASAAAASKNSAAESESAAASSAGDAASSKTAAAGSASAAATSASAAAASQAAAENSQKAAESSASASASSASNAKNSETSAAASAAAAARSAEEASTSAVAASNSESSALESKNAASGSASAAASSAEEAKSSQSAASESASRAASSMTAAESSASAAAASAEAAESSKTAAAGSQTEASASASAAAASAEAAESSKKAAAVSETEAETYKTAAQEAARQAQESAQLAQQISQGAMGWYATDATLREAHPTGENGQWAIVGSTDTIWTWDSDTSAWKNTSVKTDLSNYYTKEQASVRFEMPVGFVFSWAPVSGRTEDLSTAQKVAAHFGYGTWKEITGRFTFGRDASHAVGSVGGEETHTLEQSEMPEYTYGSTYSADIIGEKTSAWLSPGVGSNIGYGPLRIGGGQPHNNMPPYLTVYKWQRIG